MSGRTARTAPPDVRGAGRTSPPRSTRARRLPVRGAFVVAATSLVLVFAAAGAVIPMLQIYRVEERLSSADFALSSVGYFIAAATGLLLLGRLSDHWGRRPVSVFALLLAVAGCLLLLDVDAAWVLVVARSLQGLACGVASGALGAFVIDSSGDRRRWLPAMITASAPMLGLPFGAISSGASAAFGPAPRELAFVVLVVVLLSCAALIAVCPESVTRRPGAVRSLRPHLTMPTGARRALLVTAAVFVATWPLGGFYQTFGPLVTADNLGSANALVAAAVFASVMVLNPLGAPLGGRMATTAGVRLGMAVYVVALAAVTTSLFVGLIAAFLIASLTCGVSQGVAATAAMRSLLARTGPADRAGLLSTLYLVTYGSLSLTGFVAGLLTTDFELDEIAIGYACLGIASALLAIAAVRKDGVPGPG